MEQIQQHGAIIAVVVLLVIPLLYTFRKYTYPTLYHATEYVIYCAAVHLVLGGLLRFFSYFHEETKFKNYNGTMKEGWTAYTNPLNLQFWDKSQYSPEWFFYAECAVAVGLLYVVIFLRPTSFKSNNAYKKQKDKARAQTASVRPGGATYDRNAAAPRGASKSKVR
jgi:hypothetical protein